MQREADGTGQMARFCQSLSNEDAVMIHGLGRHDGQHGCYQENHSFHALTPPILFFQSEVVAYKCIYTSKDVVSRESLRPIVVSTHDGT